MRVIEVLKLIRIPNDILIGFAVIIGSYVSLKKLPEIDVLSYGFLSGFFISASIMVLNDIYDINIDKINNPTRPLPSGRLSILTAYLVALFTFLLGIITSFLISFYTFIIAIIFWFLGYLYNSSLKRKGIIGNIIVSISVAIPFIYGAIAVSKFLNPLIIIFSLMAFMANMSREIIKGIIDIMGDKKFYIKTIAVRYGPKRASYISILFLFIAILLSYTPILFSFTSSLFYLIIITISNMTFIIMIMMIFRNYNKKLLLIKIKNYMLVGMALALVALILS